jgi:hypothetical protein
MPVSFFSLRLPVAACAFLLCAAALCGPAAAARPLTPQQWQEDLALVRATIASTHPDISHSTDPATLARALDDAERTLRRPLTQDQGWRVLATLNPLFADAHFCVCYDDWRTEARAVLATGHGLFPFAVDVDERGAIVITRWLAGASTPLAGARIATIDGRPAADISATLLARMHGDTLRFRAGVLSQRFAFYYAAFYGTPSRFDIELAVPSRRLRVAANRQGAPDLVGTPRFEDAFALTMLPSRTAVLRIDTFAWPDKDRVVAFHRDAFARLREAGVDTLLIDVRNNGGGNDDQWIDGVLPYLATAPYRWASSYRKRILEKYRKDGEIVGDVVEGRIDRVIEPQPDHPLRFTGKTYVLVGRGTYSSAVLFANVMQDYGFATLAGTGGAARTQQSGSVQRVVLPHSKLAIAVPRFILQRPSGAATPVLMTPDIAIDEDPLRPERAIERLLQRIAAP